MVFPHTFHQRIILALAGVAFALLALPAPAVLADTPPELPAIDPTLLAQLRQGGFVIFVRHAQTELGNIPLGSETIAKCETQRNLSAAGKQTAKELGHAFKTLRIPVGEVLSSPFCRCKDTAQLAFGKYTVDRNLYFSLNLEADARKHFADTMRKMLASPPAAGTNTVIVSHTANLREATGYWPKPEGAAYVFRPGPDDTFMPVARMAPGDWRLLMTPQQRP